MIWIRDYQDRMVNIDRWEFLDHHTLEDKISGKVAAHKIYVYDKDGYEHTLGYLKEADEDLMRQISLGFEPYFQSLESCLYDYLDDEFDEITELNSDKFDEMYEARKKEIKKLLNSRFVYTEG